MNLQEGAYLAHSFDDNDKIETREQFSASKIPHWLLHGKDPRETKCMTGWHKDTLQIHGQSELEMAGAEGQNALDS